MSDDYEVGYGKPPKAHRFGPGNQAARGRKKTPRTFSIPELIEQALNRRRKIKRGDQVVTMKAGEIMIERWVQMMTTGSPRDLVMMIGMIERHAPRFFEQQAAHMAVTYHQAEGSEVGLPPADLWDKKS